SPRASLVIACALFTCLKRSSITQANNSRVRVANGPSLATAAAKGVTGMITNTRRLLFAVICLAALAMPALAQQTTGTIAGRVLPEQKAAVPGATVTVKNQSTGFSRTEVSDTEGLYRITGLPVGTYALSIEMSGFQAQSRTVQVSVSETLSADFDLHIAK